MSAFEGVGTAHAAHLAQGEGDVAFGGEVIEEVEFLKDHAHVLTQVVEFSGVFEIDLAVAEPDFALIGFEQAVDALQKGALARAGRADEHFDVARTHADGAVVEDFSSGKIFGEVFRAKNGGVVLRSVHGVSRHHMPELL